MLLTDSSSFARSAAQASVLDDGTADAGASLAAGLVDGADVGAAVAAAGVATALGGTLAAQPPSTIAAAPIIKPRLARTRISPPLADQARPDGRLNHYGRRRRGNGSTRRRRACGPADVSAVNSATDAVSWRRSRRDGRPPGPRRHGRAIQRKDVEPAVRLTEQKVVAVRQPGHGILRSRPAAEHVVRARAVRGRHPHSAGPG